MKLQTHTILQYLSPTSGNLLQKLMGAINNIATINAINGARLNKNLSAPDGVIPSFTNNFTVSAND